MRWGDDELSASHQLAADRVMLRPMTVPSGFEYTLRKNGEVAITHHGRPATVLRGRRAERFLAGLDGLHDQEVMARFTGNYKRGNERRRG